MTAGTAEVVITTKLFRPGLRQQTVERKRLYDLLREGRTLPLTLVVAPAGWGKSTIVADWLARDDVTAGWVSLDGGDNDPKRFWRYLLLAAGQAGSAAGPAALRRLDAAGSDMLREVLPAFVNELASAQAPLVLVLDDYHLVTSTQVHATVATLLDRCPPQLHLMLITRADPPLPLSRLRYAGTWPSCGRRDPGPAGRSAHGAARAAAIQGRGRGRGGGPAAGDLTEYR